ncbi:MAG TPA: hypothetical protein DDW65_11615 [Firmicutes bacterium]|nr:hypothetical protein [Bacillota bacterium]
MKKHLFMILIILIIANPVKAEKIDNIVDTKEYFPIDIPHSYVETQGSNQWRITFLGSKTIDNRQAYVISTFILPKDREEKLSDKSLYTINDAGDILKVGVSYTEWLNKWYPQPELYLKGKMEIGTSYTIQKGKIDGNSMITYLKLRRRLNLKLQNCTVECILVEKTVLIEEFTSTGSEIYPYIEWRYFAKGIGFVKYSGNGYQCQCGTQVPCDGKITLTGIEND